MQAIYRVAIGKANAQQGDDMVNESCSLTQINTRSAQIQIENYKKNVLKGQSRLLMGRLKEE